jgi:hypothetical protein
MNEPKATGYGLIPATESEWAGWQRWTPVDPFEEATGPFFCKPEGEDVVCGFRPGTDHLAGGIGTPIHGVTVTLNCEFAGAAEPGRLLTARGEVIRAGGSLVFARGLIDDQGRAVLAFSGTIKRVRGT